MQHSLQQSVAFAGRRVIRRPADQRPVLSYACRERRVGVSLAIHERHWKAVRVHQQYDSPATTRDTGYSLQRTVFRVEASVFDGWNELQCLDNFGNMHTELVTPRLHTPR